MVADLIPWLLNNPEVGWVVVILYLMWEIRGPKGKINDLAGRIAGIVVVVRALASVNDSIDSEKVDDYLVENGSSPSDFIKGNFAKRPEHPRRDLIEDEAEEQGEDQSKTTGD